MSERTYVFEKYATTKENVKKTLEDYGVAIIPNILTPEECEEMKEGMWQYLEYITEDFEKPIKRDNEESWRSFRQLLPKHSMLMQEWSVGHCQMVWNLRQNPKIYEVFSEIWKVAPKDLLVSFDGASFHFPPEITKLGWYRGNNWLHCDQSYLRNDFECVQSWINAYDTNEGDATLTFFEGSHKYHKEFKERFNIDGKEDWYKLENSEQHDFYVHEKGCPQHHIRAPAGSLVLWDSRTIHSGTEPEKSRSEPNFRCVSYLCYMPRRMSTTALLRKKVKAFEELRTTSHWAHKPSLFSKTPRTYGAELPPVKQIGPPTINTLARRFIGYN